MMWCAKNTLENGKFLVLMKNNQIQIYLPIKKIVISVASAAVAADAIAILIAKW